MHFGMGTTRSAEKKRWTFPNPIADHLDQPSLDALREVQWRYHPVRVTVLGDFDDALRRFRRFVQDAGLIREMRRRSHYIPRHEARRVKALRARRRKSR